MSTQVASRQLVFTPAVRFGLVTLGGALLTALAAQISIPLFWTPVPVTLQTLAVLLLAVYGGRFSSPAAAVASQLTYLGLGLAGIPVFAAAIGATLGYALAFPAAAAIAGLSTRKHMPLVGRVLALCGASALTLASGACWLAWTTRASFAETIAFAVAPFIAVEAAKIAVTSLAFFKK